MIYHAESPLKETYNTCSLALSEAVRKNGLKVILTGEGADELFAGYIGYRFDEKRAELGYDADDISWALEEQESEKLWGDRNFFYEIRQHDLRETKMALYSEGVKRVFHEFDSVSDGLLDKSKLRGRHPIHKRSYLDFKLRLSDYLLSDHGDRVAYANSVEAHYPFLDINLLEFAKTVPPHLKLNGLVEKYLIKKMAGKYLPEQIIKREKFGFVAPGSTYLIKRNITWLDDILSYDRIKRQGYFDPDVIERLKKRYTSNNFTLNLPFENDLLMIVICCITSHYYLPRLPQEIAGKIISLIDVIVESLVATKRPALLLATSGTYQKELFFTPAHRKAKEYILIPNDADKARVHRIIYEKLKPGKNTASVYPEIKELLRKYEVNAFIAGCTEFHSLVDYLLSQGINDISFNDPLLIIAKNLKAIMEDNFKKPFASDG